MDNLKEKLESRLQILTYSKYNVNPLMRDAVNFLIKDYKSILDSK